MSDLIKKVTKPYIHEAVAAIFIDAILGLVLYLLIVLCYHEYVFALWAFAPFVLMALVLDAPLLIMSLRDRKAEAVLEEICTVDDILEETCFSNKLRLEHGEPSLLTTWYYPKEWNMHRYKLILKTKDGKKFKARSVHSWHHGQLNFWCDLCGIQENAGDQMFFKVQYCKYSKALLSIRMVSWPPDMKSRTKDYIDSNLRDILKWTIKV